MSQDDLNRPPTPAAAEQVAHPWLVAVSVMFGTFMVVLDTTVVNVSLPHIAGTLSASIEETTWSLTSYLTANAIILPITGWLANFFGRRRLLLLSVSGFSLASVLCGLATSLPLLIFWRVVQGATGGVMQPLSQAVMLEAFPPRDRGRAMAVFGVGIVAAPVLGPVVGGWLTDNWSWRWVFYVNLPVGIAAFLAMRAFVFDPYYIRRSPAGIDYWGIGLLAIGVASLQIALDQGQRKDWFASHFITTLLVVAGIGLLAFIVHALVARHPVVNLRLFMEPTYATGVFMITVMGFGLYGSLVLMPVLLQVLMGYPAVDAGFAMAPRGLGAVVAMPVVGNMIARTDPRKMISAGCLVNAVTLYWLSRLNLDAGYWDIFWPQFCQGIGLGLLFVPLTTVTMDRIDRADMGNATSLFNLMRNIGGSMGIATTETLLSRYRQMHTTLLVGHVDPYSPHVRTMVRNLEAEFMAKGADAVTATERAYAAIWGMVQEQAAILSFLDTFQVIALVFVLLVPLAFLMRRPLHQATSGVGAGE